METLVIHIPNKKSALVKQILEGLGVTMETREKISQKPSAHDFLGAISEKDVKLMEKAIEDGCENIHPDDWK